MMLTCFASWGEPGNGELDCILAAGHDGLHRIEHEWEEAPIKPYGGPISAGYLLFLGSHWNIVEDKGASCGAPHDAGPCWSLDG